MTNKTMEIGKLYKTPWKVAAYMELEWHCHSKQFLIDSDSEVVVLADGDCVVVLDVRKIKLTKWQNSEATREFILKVLCPCGSIGFVHATSAGLIYWKKTGKHEQ